jgi:Raf kinase inhibitor-like YbhB/YbcL family protein
MTHRTFVKFAPALALIALTSCGAKENAANQSSGGTAVEIATLTKLALTSSAFQDGQPIPLQYSCDGANQSPPLAWGEPPQGTKSFALIVDDPDAPSGTFRHWGAYQIPVSTRFIAAGQQVGTQAINGFGKPGYGGPCPPKGHGPHHYHFKLYALDVERLETPANAKVEEVETAAQAHAIGKGELIGTYERK